MTLLSAHQLNICYDLPAGRTAHVVRDVDVDFEQGELVGLVGESGCGKSTLGYGLTRLLRPPAHQISGTVIFDGEDVSHLDKKALAGKRRGGFTTVLQSGMNALNPVRSVEGHFFDVLRAHQHIDRRSARRRGEELLALVHLPAEVLDRYPHELSGGMRQRVAIAITLALDPRMVVFDEPTTALDVLVQRAVIDTIVELQARVGFTALIISHDLGLLLETAQRLLVMYAGRIVEERSSKDLLENALHPYSQALLGCYADPSAEVVDLAGIPGSPPDLSGDETGCAFAPRCPLAQQICLEVSPPLELVSGGKVACHFAQRKIRARPDTDCAAELDAGVGLDAGATASVPVHRAAACCGSGALVPSEGGLVVTDLVKEYRSGPLRGKSWVHAVDGVSFAIEPGVSVGLVGASGSGKSTIARMITGMERPSSGTIHLGKLRVDTLRRRALRKYWSLAQLIFQDPYSALNPIHTVGYALSRPLVNHRHLSGKALRNEVLRLLEIVGLTPVAQFEAKLPHQLSGGQRQRVVIARALAAGPTVIVADEPVSMLDVSLRAGILSLLSELRRDTGISLLYITHDLLSARVVADELMVLNEGRIVESGRTADVLRSPNHAYTKRLIAAIPRPQASDGSSDADFGGRRPDTGR